MKDSLELLWLLGELMGLQTILVALVQKLSAPLLDFYLEKQVARK